MDLFIFIQWNLQFFRMWLDKDSFLKTKKNNFKAKIILNIFILVISRILVENESNFWINDGP